MKQPNLNALLEFFSVDLNCDFIEDPNSIVTLRYTFSVEDKDGGKDKIFCEIVSGNLTRHQTFLLNLAKNSEVKRGFVEYLHEYNGALLYRGEKDVFLPDDEEEDKKEGDQ